MEMFGFLLTPEEGISSLETDGLVNGPEDLVGLVLGGRLARRGSNSHGDVLSKVTRIKAGNVEGRLNPPWNVVIQLEEDLRGLVSNKKGERRKRNGGRRTFMKKCPHTMSPDYRVQKVLSV